MDNKDIERYWELVRKSDDGIITEEEEFEMDSLLHDMQLEEESNLRNWYQFGY